MASSLNNCKGKAMPFPHPETAMCTHPATYMQSGHVHSFPDSSELLVLQKARVLIMQFNNI